MSSIVRTSPQSQQAKSTRSWKPASMRGTRRRTGTRKERRHVLTLSPISTTMGQLPKDGDTTSTDQAGTYADVEATDTDPNPEPCQRCGRTVLSGACACGDLGPDSGAGTEDARGLTDQDLQRPQDGQDPQDDTDITDSAVTSGTSDPALVAYQKDLKRLEKLNRQRSKKTSSNR